MTIFRFILQEYGFISAEDTHLKDLLRDSDDTVWKHAAYLLETAKLMPGGCFTLELTSTPPLEAINALVEENKTDRDAQDEAHGRPRALDKRSVSVFSPMQSDWR